MRIGLGMSIVGGGYAPSGITYLSDVGGTPTAAYSVRKVVSDYSGSAIRVRESSGDTETDIGFDGENLDEAALLAHCGANDGFVAKWYDQSGSGYDAIQATAGSQPKIVSAGSVIKENGLPALSPNDGFDHLLASYTGSSEFWCFSVIKDVIGWTALITGASDEVILSTRDGSSSTSISSNAGSVIYYLNGSTPSWTTQDDAHTDLTTRNLVSVHADTSTWSELGIGYRYAGQVGMFKMQELIIYHSDKSALRTAIEGNINDYYSIYP